jgi:hypothetical protein
MTEAETEPPDTLCSAPQVVLPSGGCWRRLARTQDRRCGSATSRSEDAAGTDGEPAACRRIAVGR